MSVILVHVSFDNLFFVVESADVCGLEVLLYVEVEQRLHLMFGFLNEFSSWSPLASIRLSSSVGTRQWLSDG